MLSRDAAAPKKIQATQKLLHILLSKVHNDTTDGGLSSLGFGDTPIRIDVVIRHVRGVISVGEANFFGKRRVTHVPRTTGHGWQTVGIGVGKFEQFLVSLSHQPGRLGCGTSPRIVKALSQLGSFVVERLPVNGPAQERSQRLAVEAGDLQKRGRGAKMPVSDY